jgi:hypothetical protein
MAAAQDLPSARDLFKAAAAVQIPSETCCHCTLHGAYVAAAAHFDAIVIMVTSWRVVA